jgi:hypothetical protein
LVVEYLMQMGLHLVVGRIDVGAQSPRMLRDLIGLAHILGNAPAHPITAIGQFRIDDFGRYRFDDDGSGRKPRRRSRRLRRLPGRGPWLRPLLPFGLRLGLSPHLGDATQKIFDFVFHDKPFQVPSFKFHVRKLETWNL